MNRNWASVETENLGVDGNDVTYGGTETFDCYPQRMNSYKHNEKRLGSFPSCDEVSCKQLSVYNGTKKEEIKVAFQLV